MNSIDKKYQALLQDILDNGVEKKDRTGTGTISVFGRQIRHDMKTGFPLLTTKKMYFKGIVAELLWFLKGDTNIKWLLENDCKIWVGDAFKKYKQSYMFSSNPISYKDSKPGNGPWDERDFIRLIVEDEWFGSVHGELGPLYGRQWRSWHVTGKEDEVTGEYFLGNLSIDQIANLINDLKTNPDSRRLMVSAWNVGELDQMVLPPCHYGFQVYTRELNRLERIQLGLKAGWEPKGFIENFVHEDLDGWNIPTRAISLMWNQRSNDFFLGIPYNIPSYALLLEIIAREVNMIPEEVIGNLGDVHLYLNHIEQAKEQIKREPYALPTLRIVEDYLGLYALDFDRKIEMMKPSFFAVDNYVSHPTIKAPLSN